MARLLHREAAALLKREPPLPFNVRYLYATPWVG